MDELPDLSALSVAQKDALIIALFAQVKVLTATVRKLTARVDIRMPNLKQKTSGCFRTVAGANSFAIIRSYLATLRKQGRNVFHALPSVFQNRIPNPVFSG